MELLNEKTDKKINNLDKGSLCDAHKSAKSVDDRFNITDKEKEKVKETYFNEDGFLKKLSSERERKRL
ncbi:LuxR family transcriptional regulator [Clostridium carnis]|uniref:LuxR family transcriptional regulator n=1 Tax=Clostridium carnis TaxID=1530 RepID=A0ABY6SWR0_9CLOT|nr:LuxR family transcriptional regulator [Clostridium carnis]